MKILSDLIGRLAAKTRGTGGCSTRRWSSLAMSMGDANIHDNTNLPIILAGGGFDHGQHLAFRKECNTPLSNLFVTMLQRLGIETDHLDRARVSDRPEQIEDARITPRPPRNTKIRQYDNTATRCEGGFATL
jgi:hypothetical protein